MKKIILIVISCILGLFLTEVFFRFVIKFPVYNINYKVHGISKMRDLMNVYRANAKYWSIEAGNKVFTRNNLGLPGIDVDTSSGKKYIYILGNSYIEALAVNPEENPVSVFQYDINRLKTPYQALNLAYSGQDPYSLYFRSRYYENYYHPSFVILLINWDYPLLHSDSLDFRLPENFGVINNNFKTQAIISVRNHSSYFELFAKSLNKLSNKNNLDLDKNNLTVIRNIPSENKANYSGIKTCISKFNEIYRGKFLCIYFGQNPNLGKALHIHCANENIPYFAKNISAIKGVNKVGHLNKFGCKQLGDVIYESFCKFL
jgi:hypothetical protein